MRKLITLIIASILVMTLGYKKVNGQTEAQSAEAFVYGIKYNGKDIAKVLDIQDNYLYEFMDDYGYVDIYMSQFMITDSTAVTYWEFIPEDKDKEPFMIQEGSVINNVLIKDSVEINVVAIVSAKRAVYQGVITIKDYYSTRASMSLWDFTDGSVITYYNFKFVNEFMKEDYDAFMSERNLSHKKFQ